MKKIKIKLVGFGKHANLNGFRFKPDDNFILDILKKHFDIEFSEDPDFIIYGLFDYGIAHFKYDAVRLYFMQEFVEPDYNVCDYAMGLSHQTFEDRYFRYLPYMYFLGRKTVEKAEQKVKFDRRDLKKKDKFCAFVHANGHAPERNRMFELLNGYKEISSGGRYKNNIGYYVKDKKKFFSECKFALIFENSYGYDSDRLVECFLSGTIPIYWGDPHISEEFNDKAFINVHKYASLEEVVEAVKEIDQDEERYLKMMKEPMFLPSFHLDEYEKKLEEFLVHIFSQTREEAYRRNRNYWGYAAEKIAYSGAKCRAARIFILKVLTKLCMWLHLEKCKIWLTDKIFYYR